MSRKTFWIGLASAAIIRATTTYLLWPRSEWTQDEITTLRGLWIGSLSALPPDPSNKVADDQRAVVLGQKLFFDTRLSSNGKVACARSEEHTSELQSRPHLVCRLLLEKKKKKKKSNRKKTRTKTKHEHKD